MSKRIWPNRQDWLKAIRAGLVLFAVVISTVTLAQVKQSQATYHQQTIAELKAENCTTASCESPAIKAVISQAVAGVTAAVTTANKGELQLLCYSLANLNTTNPTAQATAALLRYCPPAEGTP